MEWILAHYNEVFAIIGQVVIVATGIVALTPSTRDDEFLGKVVGLIEKLSIIAKRTK